MSSYAKRKAKMRGEKMEKEKPEYEDYEIERDGERNLSFKGKLIASSSTRTNSSSRWTDYSIYKTIGGKIVFAIGVRTLWQGENDSHMATVYKGLPECFEELEGEISYEALKDLAEQLDVDLSEHVE